MAREEVPGARSQGFTSTQPWKRLGGRFRTPTRPILFAQRGVAVCWPGFSVRRFAKNLARHPIQLVRAYSGSRLNLCSGADTIPYRSRSLAH